jgi:hypothetical protein
MGLEDSLQSWAKAPGETEQTKCDNAVAAIRKAIDAHPGLVKRNIKAFAQGSYCNRTNVRQDSDVDVCVLCKESMFYDLPTGMSPSDFNFTVPAIYSYPQFKNDVGSALTSHFVNGHVVPGKKAFDIRENSYRIAADAVPCFLYKKFSRDGSSIAGVAFVPDNGQRIVNWPEQNYANGVAKNTATGQRFKDVARILKRLRYKMKEEKIAAAEPVPSFLLECLAYNVPDETLRLATYTSVIRESLVYLYDGTQNPQSCAHWKEVNQEKPLFDAEQVWTCSQANSFILAVWSDLGFQ